MDALEERLGVPVVTSTQAHIWDAVRLAGVEDVVPGYGKLWRQQHGRHDEAVRCVW